MSLDLAQLLPGNATALQRALAGAKDHTLDRPTAPIETIWDAWACPAQLLDVLAWAMSLDLWDESWPEVVKRQAIADSPAWHRRKGTSQAVRDALALAADGRPAEIVEWFDQTPEGRRGTARVHIEAPLDAVAEILAKARTAINAAKPKARAIAIGVGERFLGEAAIGAGLAVEELTLVEPYAYAGEAAEGAAVVGAGLLLEEMITVETT